MIPTSRLPAAKAPVVVFLPYCDGFGTPLDARRWRHEAVDLLSGLFGNASLHCVGAGSEVDAVVSLAPMDIVTSPSALKSLRDFLIRFGQQARQHEVGVVVGHQYYGIVDFKEET